MQTGVPHHLGDLHLPSGVGGHLLGTALAATAAALFAVGTVAVHGASAGGAGSAVDWGALLRRRAWRVGQAANVAAAVIQVAALGLAPVGIVQPVLAGGLVVALGIQAVLDRAVPPPVQVVGALCAAGGLAVFLVAARPGSGTRHAGLLPTVAVAAAILVLALATARLPRGPAGAVTAGLVAGVALGVTAVLVSAALDVLQHEGILAALAAAPTWAAVATAVAAQFASQQAFARGRLRVSLPVLTVVDPLVAVPAAWALLGEHLAPGHARVWGPAVALAAVGVVLLSRDAPAVTAERRRPGG